MATGTISWTKFKKDALEIIRHSGHIHDGWQYTTIQIGSEQCGFLQKRNVHRLSNIMQKSNSTDNGDQLVTMDTENKDAISMEKDLEDDRAVAISQSELTARCVYEYHVVYSLSYAVPVLYFNASKEDGRMLSLEEVWDNVTDSYQSSVSFDKWSFITQQEHPFLRRPFFQIHPCHTADVMKATGVDWTDNENNYLVTWLSTIGPVVGLNLAFSYGTLDKG